MMGWLLLPVVALAGYRVGRWIGSYMHDADVQIRQIEGLFEQWSS